MLDLGQDYNDWNGMQVTRIGLCAPLQLQEFLMHNNNADAGAE